jgi:hypothetical protein
MNRSIKTSVRLALDRYPALYLGLLRIKRRGHWSREWLVQRRTQVVIEGFPRSANSFAREAFLTNQRDIVYATHVHSSAQVVQGCLWKIPTLVLMRDPAGAICGDVAFACELQQRDAQSVHANEIDDSLRRYIAFYERVEPFHQRFVIGHFPDVTKDFGAVMKAFNDFFGTRFVVFEHTDEAAAKITGMSFHIGPRANRDAIKMVVRHKYDRETAPELKERALSIYQRLLILKGLDTSVGDQ